MKKVFFVFFIAISVLGISCSRDKAKLSGRIVGSDSLKLYLERVLPSNRSVVDSATTNDRGYFNFRVKLPARQATMFNLRSGNDAIPLIISPGENVKIHSLGNIAKNYAVEGSPESERMREFRQMLSDGVARLDSILNVYGFTFDEKKKKEIGVIYTSTYYKMKQDHIKFIMTDPGSLASLYALYQRLPNDYVLFNGDTDILYYRQVADSTAKKYPDSPYVKALQKEIEASEAGDRMSKFIEDKLSQGAVGYPDLNMQDMYGKWHKISDLTGKVVLVDFWSATSPESKLNNAELKILYDRYRNDGFEIYQVSVDETPAKPIWVNAVQQQKLPWISVCDFTGSSGNAVRLYNVVRLPANFIIDRKGDILYKDLYGEKLEARVKQLLN